MKLTNEMILRVLRSMPNRPWGIGSTRGDALAFARAILKEAGVEEMAEKAELHDAIQEAAGALVGGYSIELKVERHAGWVDMFDADGCLQDFPSNHESLADSVRDALAEAIRCTEQDKQ